MTPTVPPPPSDASHTREPHQAAAPSVAPTISIVVPTLDAGAYVVDTIASLEGSPRDGRRWDSHRLEVIVVDGGSSDDTLDWFRASGLEDLTIVKAPELNQAAAINRGFELATGEILGWLNGDDIHWPGAVTHVARAFTDDPDLVLLYGHAVAMDETGRHYGVRPHVRAADHSVLLADDVIVQPASFWRRSTWERFGPLDATYEYVFDYDFFLRVAAERPLRFDEVALAGERLHAATKTAGGGERRIAELERLMVAHTGTAHVPETFLGEPASVELRALVRELREGRFATRTTAAAGRLRTQPVSGAARLALSAIGGERLYLRTLLRVTKARNVLRRQASKPAAATDTSSR